jgi:glycosyltransferase involved in cell wall biosynthesis
LFFIYRPKLIPDAVKKIALWRQLFKDNHDEKPLIYMVQAFDDIDPRPFGLDGAIEFPPHKVASGLPSVAYDKGLLDPNFEGHYPSYDAMVDKSNSDIKFDYDLIKCVTPSWDNEARKPGRGMGFIDSTPKKYQAWLSNCVAHAKKHPVAGEHKFVAINAWNEWAEGSHLEPDIYWGSAYLNATFKALHNLNDIDGKYSLLLVGHDAYKHGAQLLTLNIFRTLKQQFGIDVKVALLDGGPLVDDYKKIGDTYVCNGDVAQFSAVVTHLKKECGLSRAICNTTVTGKIARVLDEQNISFISLIHELKNLIKEYELEDAADDIAQYADKIIFAAAAVKNSFQDVVGEVVQNKLIVHPQGIYQTLDYDAEAHEQLRKRLGLASNSKIITNVGYADLRKGFDLFVNLAKLLVQKNSEYHFVWIGDIEPGLKRWLASDLESKLLVNNFHNVFFTDEISTYLNGADVFAMTSREDPFPSVVLESLALGTPVVGFEGGGGFTDLLQNSLNGQTVAMADITAMAKAIEEQIQGDSVGRQRERSKLAVDTFKWDDYVFSLLEYLDPDIKRATVSVPNYNYAEHIEERLQSIFDQGYPIFEINVLDDKSTDNSVDVIEKYCLSRKRKVNLIVNELNSGSVFKQWKKCADMARGEFLWLAEADDAAAPTFLEKMLGGDTDFTLAYTDSVQVDESNSHLAANYRYYYDKGLADKLDKPGIYLGAEIIEECLAVKNQFMNVSAVLFSTSEFKHELDYYLKDILEFKVAGDWFLYVQMLSNKDAKCKIVGGNLNVHRRHSASVTHKNLDIQLVEIDNVHKLCNKVMDHDDLLNSQRDYIKSIEVYIKEQSKKGIEE